jgi:hypothetical protein
LKADILDNKTFEFLMKSKELEHFDYAAMLAGVKYCLEIKRRRKTFKLKIIKILENNTIKTLSAKPFLS